jgi:hypothetical protein
MLNIYNPNNHNGDKSKAKPHTEPQSGSGTGVQSVKTNFSKYEDPTKEFTSEELKLGFWYLKHKAFLYKILIIWLIGVDAVFVIFGLWQWGDYLLDLPEYRQLQANLATPINYIGIHSRYSAMPLQVAATQIFSSRENKYDATAELINPNSRFLAEFDYYFIINDERTPSQKTFLLPGESRPVAYLGIKNGAGGAPAIVLENIKYQRISAHKISNTADWQAYRLNFQASDFVFLKSLAQEGQNTDVIQFKLTNNSPYSYAATDFYVSLLQNGQMVGILPLHLDSINSLEIKNIDLRNFVSGLSVTEIALYPIINVYDETAYIK